jgi:hypothetical protein
MDFFADTPIQFRKKYRGYAPAFYPCFGRMFLYGSSCHGDPTINIARTVPMQDFNLFIAMIYKV